jgi:hypothetical protein
MNTPSRTQPPETPDKVFLVLGQAVYAGQLFEATMLEVLATARELLDGTGDGTAFEDSIESLSKKTLGQLLVAFQARADIRPDVESILSAGLEARNFVVHRFAQHVGDEVKQNDHQRTLYEKCIAIIAANDVALAMLRAIGQQQVQRSTERVSRLRQTATALRERAARLGERKR